MKNSKPLIFAIVGPSGSGKTVMANHIEEEYGIKMIESYTDRPPRHEGERGHIFVTPEEFDEFDLEDMIAHTKFGDYRYCCLKDDVDAFNTYVIDEDGLNYLTTKFKDVYDVHSVRVERDAKARAELTEPERILRDEGRFKMPYVMFDSVVFNNGTIDELLTKTNQVVDAALARKGYLR